MTLKFSIKFSGHRKIFRQALELDTFIHANKLPKSATISLITENEITAGTLTVQQYLRLEKKYN